MHDGLNLFYRSPKHQELPLHPQVVGSHPDPKEGAKGIAKSKLLSNFSKASGEECSLIKQTNIDQSVMAVSPLLPFSPW